MWSSTEHLISLFFAEICKHYSWSKHSLSTICKTKMVLYLGIVAAICTERPETGSLAHVGAQLINRVLCEVLCIVETGCRMLPDQKSRVLHSLSISLNDYSE